MSNTTQAQGSNLPLAPESDLGISATPHTVDVHIINSGATIRGIRTCHFVAPSIEGHDWLAVPVFSFLVQHPGLHRSLLFDLGIRKDWENLSRPVVSRTIKALGWNLHVEKDVCEMLDQNGIDTKSIEAVIWSHHHFDHTGNPGTFGPKTALIVGPGFQQDLLPGYPANPDSTILESDYANRELIELDFVTGRSGNTTFTPVTIGGLRALDYFGDGSFYLLHTPGHTRGHISGLARVASNPAAFVLLSGDLFHHAGELRPSKHVPLPSTITPDPFFPDPHPLESHYGCPGAIFDGLLARRGRPSGDGPFYEPARADKELASFHEDVDEMLRTLEKVQELDAHENILVVAAHDETLLDVLDFFPAGKLNHFFERGWVKRVRWRFLRDFAKAVGRQDHELILREWGPERQGEEEREVQQGQL